MKLQMDRQTLLLLIIFIILVVGFGIFEDGFLTQRSIFSMAFQLPEIGLLSYAMMLPYLVGGINLAINASSNLSALIGAIFLLKFIPLLGLPESPVLQIGAVFVVAVLVGIAAGLFNGFLVGYINAPPILATLASMAFFTGISVGLTKGSTITGFPQSISLISNTSYLGVPTPFLIFIGVKILLMILMNKSSIDFK